MEQKIFHIQSFVRIGDISDLENAPQFLDGYPNDGSCMVDPDTKEST